MENVFNVLTMCQQLDNIPVDDLSLAVGMLSTIGVKRYNTDATRRSDIEHLNQMYQYWH